MSVVAGSFFLADPNSNYCNEINADGGMEATHLSASPPVNKPKASRPKGVGETLAYSESARWDYLKEKLAPVFPFIVGVCLSVITTSFLKWKGWLV